VSPKAQGAPLGIAIPIGHTKSHFAGRFFKTWGIANNFQLAAKPMDRSPKAKHSQVA